MSKIEWTNETWNPFVGCSKVSAGCENCYAEKMANRLSAMPLKNDSHEFFDTNGIGAYAMVTNNGRWNGKTMFIPSALEKPFNWKKPRMIFVCSMSDLFHEKNKFEDIQKVFDVICQTPQHTYQLLTKRPERALEFYKWMSANIRNAGFDSIPSQSDNLLDYIDAIPNVWLGVTAENQAMAVKRIPILIKIPAKVHFVSVEPMLSAVQIDIWFYSGFLEPPFTDVINWVICGAESGPNRRELNIDWVRHLRDQCIETNTAFFLKQIYQDRKKIIMPVLDGKVWQQFPTKRKEG